MSSPDIRAGVSLLLAALAADGESIIHNVEQIDRGYQNIDKKTKCYWSKNSKNRLIKYEENNFTYVNNMPY